MESTTKLLIVASLAVVALSFVASPAAAVDADTDSLEQSTLEAGTQGCPLCPQSLEAGTQGCPLCPQAVAPITADGPVTASALDASDDVSTQNGEDCDSKTEPSCL